MPSSVLLSPLGTHLTSLLIVLAGELPLPQVYSVQIWELAHCLHKSTLQTNSNPDVIALDRHPFQDQVVLAYGVQSPQAIQCERGSKI